MDQLLFAVYTHELQAYRHRAEAHNCGLELHAFSEPTILANNSTPLLKKYKKQLAGFTGRLGMHGAFYDMISASLDPDVRALTHKRYRQCLDIAEELEVEYLIFHANYMGTMGLTDYRPGWHKRQVAFWVDFMHEAEGRDITILLENMWADDPHILYHVLADVNHPRFRACFDLAHAALYSTIPLTTWLTTLAPFLHCCHLNNHNGRNDLHWPLARGIIDYNVILDRIRRLNPPPLMTLELPDWESIEQSLRFFNLQREWA